MGGQDLIGPLLSWRWVCLRKDWLPRVGWQRIVALKSSPRAEGVRVRSESWKVVSLRWGVCHPGLTVSLDWGTRRWFW